MGNRQTRKHTPKPITFKGIVYENTYKLLYNINFGIHNRFKKMKPLNKPPPLTEDEKIASFKNDNIIIHIYKNVENPEKKWIFINFYDFVNCYFSYDIKLESHELCAYSFTSKYILYDKFIERISSKVFSPQYYLNSDGDIAERVTLEKQENPQINIPYEFFEVDDDFNLHLKDLDKSIRCPLTFILRKVTTPTDVVYEDEYEDEIKINRAIKVCKKSDLDRFINLFHQKYDGSKYAKTNSLEENV